VQGHGIDHNTAFRKYAAAILGYPDESFDLVFVDGEASCRDWCIANALPKIKPGGYLLLDDSDWPQNVPDWEKQDFVARDLKWIGQKGTFNWWTSILRKPL
jgi:predicted O-methyltransferase YrrM